MAWLMRPWSLSESSSLLPAFIIHVMLPSIVRGPRPHPLLLGWRITRIPTLAPLRPPRRSLQGNGDKKGLFGQKLGDKAKQAVIKAARASGVRIVF